MRTLPFHQVDVFSAVAFKGNPLAVIAEADGLDDDKMRAIANWTNLSETTFLSRPQDPAADYRVRIFTPTRELPFAGHPTLGSCHVWLALGGQPKADVVVQECGAGLVRIKRDGARLAFAAPPLRRSGEVSAEMKAQLARALGIAEQDIRAAQWVDNGPGWVAVLLGSRDEVLKLRHDVSVLPVARRGGALGSPARRPRGAVRDPRLHGPRRRGSGDRQPQCQPRAMADRLRPRAGALCRGPRHRARPRRPRPCRAGGRDDLDRRQRHNLRRRHDHAVMRMTVITS